MNTDIYHIFAQQEQAWFTGATAQNNQKKNMNANIPKASAPPLEPPQITRRDPLANILLDSPRITQNKMENGNFPLRFITFNVMQPCWLSNVYGNIKRLPGYSDRDIRAKKMCELLAAYDLCCLQELNNDTVVDQLKQFNIRGIDPQPDGRVAKVARSYHHVSTTGGLASAVRSDVPIIWDFVYKFQATSNETELNRSASFTLLNMINYWPGKYLLVCNVHLYEKASHDDSIVREQQRGELFDQFCDIHKRLFPLGFKWEDCGVIIAGCFNGASEVLGNKSVEYRKIMESIGVAHDLVSEVNPSAANINTFTTDENPYADKLRMNDTARIDYILSLDTIPSRQWNGNKNQRQLEICNCLPLKAEYADVIRDSLISDHFPVVANIVPRSKNEYNGTTKNNWY